MQIKIGALTAESEVDGLNIHDVGAPLLRVGMFRSFFPVKKHTSLAERYGIEPLPDSIHPLELIPWDEAYEEQILFIKLVVMRHEKHAFKHTSRSKEGYSHVYNILVHPTEGISMDSFGPRYLTSDEEKRGVCTKPLAQSPEQRLDLNVLKTMSGVGRILEDFLWAVVPGDVYTEDPKIQACAQDACKVCPIDEEQYKAIQQNHNLWLEQQPDYRITGVRRWLHPKEFVMAMQEVFGDMLSAPATLINSMVDIDRALGLPSQQRKIPTFGNCATYVVSNEVAGRIPTSFLERSPWPNWHASSIHFSAVAQSCLKPFKGSKNDRKVYYYSFKATAKMAKHAVEIRVARTPKIPSSRLAIFSLLRRPKSSKASSLGAPQVA